MRITYKSKPNTCKPEERTIYCSFSRAPRPHYLIEEVSANSVASHVPSEEGSNIERTRFDMPSEDENFPHVAAPSRAALTITARVLRFQSPISLTGRHATSRKARDME